MATEWIAGLAALGVALYGLWRVFKRDSRNDQLEKQIDQAVQQIIGNYRSEVERLTARVGTMEEDIVRLHAERSEFFEERAQWAHERAELVAQLAECQAAHRQVGLF